MTQRQTVGMLIPGTWIPGSRVADPGTDPGPVKPAICPVTAIAFIKALTARVAHTGEHYIGCSRKRGAARVLIAC